MFTDDELIKIHNILLDSPMGEVEEIITKVRQYFKEQKEAKKASAEQKETAENEKTE